MLRVGRFTSLRRVWGPLGLLALSSQGCIDEPLYLGAGGAGTGGTGQGTASSTAQTASTASTSGQGGGGGSNVPPEPALCTFLGTAGNERLFDLRPAPNGTDIVAGGDFSGSAAFDPSLVAAGVTDAFLARFNRDFEVQSARQAGVDGYAQFSAAVVASSLDRLVGLGTYIGTVGSFTSDPGGSADLFMFDFDAGLLLAAGTASEDLIANGTVGGETLYVVGDADEPGIDLGTGPMASAGFIAGYDVDSTVPKFALPLGIDMAAGSGHMVLALPDGTAWASVNLGGPGTTALDCGAGMLVTGAPRQAALLHIAQNGTCLAGRVLPSNIIEDTDLFILDGRPGLSGSFTGEMSIDDIGVTAGGSEPDAFVMLFDDQLGVTSLSSYGGDGLERPNEVIVTPSGSLIIAGEFTGTTILGDGLVASSFDDSFDIYLLKMTPEGQILWAEVFRGPDVQAASALTMNGLGDLFLGGYAAGSLDCASPEPPYAGGYDIYMMRFDAGTL